MVRITPVIKVQKADAPNLKPLPNNNGRRQLGTKRLPR